MGINYSSTKNGVLSQFNLGSNQRIPYDINYRFLTLQLYDKSYDVMDQFNFFIT